ncbi:MAG: zinc-ribbon domain-containing protein [Rhodobacter sp.]|nr:zinc-ribbon domain-containing protein [Rhodobacter sp.]
MRLICPNCDAQYEVDDNVIPEGGRDVQCSNCGHTWFQRPPHLDADLADDLEEAPLEDAGLEEPGPQEPAEEARPAAEPQPRALDPEIANVLREEAERETKARQAEAEGLETQPDLGLEDADEAAAQRSAARARMARLRGLDDAADAEPAAAVAPGGPRRELLPDIDEINSTLRASEDREGGEGVDGAVAEVAETKRRRGGFRLGFLLIVLLAVIGVAVYAFAPQIVAAVPQAEPYMAAYVEWANGLRGQIDAGLETSVAKFNELIGSFTGGNGEG